MTMDGLAPKKIPFIKHNLYMAKNISQSIIESSMNAERIWVSPILRIPPVKSNGSKSNGIVSKYKNFVCVFTILKSFLGRNLSFFLMGRNEA